MGCSPHRQHRSWEKMVHRTSQLSILPRCVRSRTSSSSYRAIQNAGAKPFTQSRIIDVCAIHRDDRHFFRQTFVDVQLKSDGTSLRQAKSPLPPKITNAQESVGREVFEAFIQMKRCGECEPS